MASLSLACLAASAAVTWGAAVFLGEAGGGGGTITAAADGAFAGGNPAAAAVASASAVAVTSSAFAVPSGLFPSGRGGGNIKDAIVLALLSAAAAEGCR